MNWAKIIAFLAISVVADGHFALMRLEQSALRTMARDQLALVAGNR